MLDRIRQLMESKGLTASQFADGMDVPRAILSHILSGRNKPSLDVVMKIASTYTDVDLEWLLLGKGEMLTSLAAKHTTKTIEYPAPAVEHEDAPLVSRHEDDIREVQNYLTDAPAPTPPVQPAKAIKQVMFFYADGTFEAYKPGA